MTHIPSAAPKPEAARQEDPAELQRGALHDLLNMARDSSHAQANANSGTEQARAELEAKSKELTARLAKLYTQKAQLLRTRASANRTQADNDARNGLEDAKNKHAAAKQASRQKADAERAKYASRLRDEVMEFTSLWDAFRATTGKTLAEEQGVFADREEAIAACRARLDKRAAFVTGKMMVDEPVQVEPAGDFDACAAEMEEACRKVESVSRATWCDNGGNFVAVLLAFLAVGVGGFFGMTASGVAVGGLPTAALGGIVGGVAGGVAGAVAFAVTRGKLARRNTATLAPLAPARQALARATATARAQLEKAKVRIEAEQKEAEAKHKTDVAQVKVRFAPLQAKMDDEIARRDITLDSEYKTASLALQKKRDAAMAACAADEALAAAKEKQRHQLAQRMQKGLEARRAMADTGRAGALDAVKARWKAGCDRVMRMISRMSTLDTAATQGWSSPHWDSWKPPATASSAYRFGQLRIEGQLPGATADFHLDLPPNLMVPALLPSAGSMFIEHDAAGRATALDLLRTALSRLLLAVPPGAVRLTMVDPVGLGEGFAGFMHLAESEVDLVGGRIWTAPEDIDRKLGDLTDHMENVIQKYLRNAYQTIEEYNTQAGELAEPYRVLVISDFPAGFSQVAMERLTAIAQTGARCGVHVMVACDQRQGAIPETVRDALRKDAGAKVDKPDAKPIEGAGAWIQCVGGKILWKDPLYGRFPFLPDGMPEEKLLTRLLKTIAGEAARFQRVEVPFHTITPKENEIWSRSAASGLRVPVGRSGVSRIQEFDLGRGTRQHALVAGKTGSGKSSFLNAVVTNLALWYAPDEAQVLLIDFKKGIEFKAYAHHKLPHAQAVAIESDLEFGLSVLRRLDGEMERRGNLFRQTGAQDLAAYREAAAAASQPKLPRVLLVIDEFQEFFTRDDKISQDAGMLLDRIARQGRAFGVHMLLGSQTLGGGASIPRSTLGQMAVRVALQCDEADAQLILSDTNTAARLLSRPGEAIYNDAAGRVEANTPFQVAWLPDDVRDASLERVRDHGKKAGIVSAGPIVFEGGAIADPAENAELVAMLKEKTSTTPARLRLFLGSPVAIKEPTCAAFGKSAGDNLLIAGPNDEAATGILSTALLGVAAQSPDASFTVLDGTPEDSPLFGALARTLSSVAGDRAKFPGMREIEPAMAELHAEVKRRNDTGEGGNRRLLVIHGLQRYRALRKSEGGGYSFSLDGPSDKPPAADKMLADIAKDGPAVGIHLVIWADGYAAFDRCFERNALREFDHRLMFQLSSADSSNLMDANDAAVLGPNRALLFSEERGIKEKCLPYRVPRPEWVKSF